MTNETIHLKLTIDVWFNPNSETEETLRGLLLKIPNYAANRGLMTSESMAEVDEWDARVERIL